MTWNSGGKYRCARGSPRAEVLILAAVKEVEDLDRTRCGEDRARLGGGARRHVPNVDSEKKAHALSVT